MPKTEEEQFIQQAATTIAPDPAKPVEPEMVYEEEVVPSVEPEVPVAEPKKEEVNWEQKLAEMQERVNTVTQENQELKYKNYEDSVEPTTTIPDPSNGVIPDAYSDPQGFANYVNDLALKKAEEINKPLMDRLKGVEMIQGEGIWVQGVKDCESQFPGFDVKKEGADLQKIMQVKNVTLLEAKKLAEFNNMQEQLTQLKSGVIERRNTPETTMTTAATRTIEDRQIIKLPKLTSDEKLYAARRGMDEKTFSTLKYKAEQAKGEMPV